MKRTIKTALLTLMLCLIPVKAYSQGFPFIRWSPTESTYNGKAFIVDNEFSRGKADEGQLSAWGNVIEIRPSGRTDLFFLSNVQLNSKPTLNESELSGTALPEGTELSLVFGLGSLPFTQVSSVTVLGNGAQPVSFESLGEKKYRIKARVINPESSASGDVNAAFGILFQYETTEEVPEVTYAAENNTFMTNLHYLDLDQPIRPRSGTLGFSAQGSNGVNAEIFAFLPLKFFRQYFIETADIPTKLKAYIGNAPQSMGVEYLGLESSYGFDLDDPENPDNTVYKLKLNISDWAERKDLLFGKLDETKPKIKIKKIVRNGSTYKLSGTITDDTSIEFFKGAYCPRPLGGCETLPKKVQIKRTADGEKWSTTVKDPVIFNGKVFFLRLEAEDLFANSSSKTYSIPR